MSTRLNILGALPTLHPFYETASVLSLLTLYLHGRIALRLAVLSAQAFAMASAVTETSAVDPETMAWGVVNLSLSVGMLAGLIRAGRVPSFCAAGWAPLGEAGTSALRRLRAGLAESRELDL